MDPVVENGVAPTGVGALGTEIHKQFYVYLLPANKIRRELITPFFTTGWTSTSLHHLYLLLFQRA